MIFEISCSADLACDQKTAELPWGVQLSFPPCWGQAREQELCQKSCLHIFRQASKNFLEKALHEKSKILIKGGVSKFRYFQHACESGADQFTYPIERCLHLACIALSCRMVDAAVVWKRFPQTLARLVFDCRRG